MPKPLIVGFGGTSSPQSTSERLTRSVLDACGLLGAETLMFDGLSMAKIPLFDPNNTNRSDLEIEFVDAIRRSDGIVIGTPSYHGGYSGLVKNAIDLLEDLRTDARIYFDDRPVGLVVTAAGWQACGTVLSSLRDVVHAMRGWPTPIGIAVNSVEQKPFDPDGSLTDGSIEAAVQAQAGQIMKFAYAFRSSQSG